MKKISFFLLPLLVLTAMMPVVPLASDAYAARGAAFTTVNQAVDGTGHCANGNPGVNCNIYNGKEFVWLNGGPKASKLGADGQYFFAVLAPGGQRTPNDGGKKNLSDDFDAYTDRTFTVTGGKVSAYAGTHWLDSGKHPLGAANDQPPLIRLFPYADTPNSGGVYIMAICSLAKGYPVRARDCKYDAFKIRNAAPTPTPTPVCKPKTETANLSLVALGASVEGLGKVAPDLDINAQNTALKVLSGVDPLAYVGNGPNGPVENGGIGPDGAFTDYQAHLNKQAHHYTFTFSPGVSVTEFTLRMLDSGDWNPTLSTQHLVEFRAYNASDVVVATETVSYTTPAEIRPSSSDKYGDLNVTGDAMTASEGEPGKWTWQVKGTGIVKVKLDFGVGYDPNLALDGLSFITECP